ncbi:hypothetical protein DFH06DRAFT_1218819 [Mycena polygramma]|nr:hypothetical protein DFH06DRAFT_1218819 [Mycena polygramma]
MFAPAYNYAPQYQRTQSSPRERYVSALSRVQQAEMEYAAYLAQQERARLLQRQAEQQERIRLVQMKQQRARQQERIRLLQVRQRNEQRRAAAVIILHAAVSSLLSGQSEQASHPGQGLKPQVAKAVPAVECDAQLQRRNRVRVVRPQETPVDTPVSAVRTALKRRLASESNVEVHATIQSILSNLSPTPTPIAPAPAVSKSAAAVHKVARAFRALASEFVFPAQLDFAPSTSGGYAAAQLPYTPRNAPIRHYEHALNGLLAQLDAIDSEGDAAVRRQRKLVVGLVEKALEDLDRIVEGRWKLQDTRARAPDAAVASASNSNTEPAAAAPIPSVDQASETQTPSTADVEPTPEPSQTFPPYERQDGASQGDSSVEIKEQESEALRIQPSILAVHEPAESDTLTNSQPGDSTGLPELELSPAAEPEIESDSQLAATEEGSDFPALESPVDDESMTESVEPTVSVSSPKSLSLEIPIPDEDLVVVDLEEKADSDSSYSVSSYSDSEWTE